MDKIKNHVTLADDDDVVSTLSNDLSHLKINDQASNEDIIAYKDSRPRYNKKTVLQDALGVADDTNKISNSKTDSAKNDNLTSSSMPDFSNPKLME